MSSLLAPCGSSHNAWHTADRQLRQVVKGILHACCLWMRSPGPPKPWQCCPLLVGSCKCSVRSLQSNSGAGVSARVYGELHVCVTRAQVVYVHCMSVLHALCRLCERALSVHVPCRTVRCGERVLRGGADKACVHNTCTCFNTPKVIASLNLSLPHIRVAAVPRARHPQAVVGRVRCLPIRGPRFREGLLQTWVFLQHTVVSIIVHKGPLMATRSLK